MTAEVEVLVPSLSEIAPAVAAEVGGILAFADGLIVTTDSEAAEASELLAKIATITKRTKDARLQITRPLDQAKKAAMEQEKTTLAPLLPVEALLRKGIGEYEAEKQRKAREEAERVERERREAEEAARKVAEEAARKAREAEEKAAEAADKETAVAAEQAAQEAAEAAERAEMERFVAEKAEVAKVVDPGPVKTASGTTSVVMVWKNEVVDETVIPREYLQVNQAAITKAVRAGVRDIPGVRIFEEAQTRVRASR